MRLHFLERRLPRTRGAVLVSLIFLGLANCNGDKVATYEPVTDPAQLYMRLTLDHAAITMAVNDTLTIAATPRDARDSALTDLPAPMFHLVNAADSLSIRVGTNGLLTALQPATGVLVIAELVAPGNVRHADTAMVNVTSGPPAAPLDMLAWHLAPGDSARWALFPPALFAAGGGLAGDSLAVYPAYLYYFVANPVALFTLAPRVQVLDAAHNPMSGLVIEYRSLDPAVADLAGGLTRWNGQVVKPLREGRARVVIEATAYGVTRADTLVFTITPPSFVPIPVEAVPGSTALFGSGGDRTVRTNSVVLWLNTLNRPVDLIFDQPADVVPAPAAYCDMASPILGYFGIIDANSHCPAGGNLTVPPAAAATKEEIWRTAQLQQFTQAGTYTFHDALTGASGRVIVTDVSN